MEKFRCDGNCGRTPFMDERHIIKDKDGWSRYYCDKCFKEMNTCLICGKLTKGSIGATGAKWLRVCQECKDEEDTLAAERIKAQAKANDKIQEVIR